MKPTASQTAVPTPTEFFSSKASAFQKRMVLYARVSTQEQTKKDYPSCQSQIEELEAHCRAKGWLVAEAIKDEGHSAGSLHRPGLTRLRSLVQSGQVEGVVCTWYDRLTRSREFYVLDKEFRTHRVDFITLHDPTDRNTASGRFMEMMLVGAKAYEREQTGEKVSIKMRMRAEKGMWNGGLVPFGFARGDDHILRPDGEKSLLIPQLFQVYVQHASDFAVRDWLRAHQIPSPTGSPVWAVGSIRDLLGNRRYVAEIEMNKGMKGVDELPEFDSYRIVKAPHEPLVTPELFELAQSIRIEKAKASPHRKGRPRSYSLNQCERVYPLQGRLYCAECGHSMSPYYVMHKPNEKEKRRNPSTIHYYICAHQMMHGLRTSGHSNRILAKVPEAWIVEQLKFLCESEGLIEEAVGMARDKASGQLQPSREALGLNKFALQENQRQIDRLIESITSGSVSGALLGLLHGKAADLQREQDDLKREERQLLGALHPLETHFDAGAVRGTLGRFCELAEAAQPEEMQRLVRTLVHRMEWQPSGDGHAVELYCLPGASKNEAQIKTPLQNQNQPSSLDKDWLESVRRPGCPDRLSMKPLVLRVSHWFNRVVVERTSLLKFG